MLNRCYFRPTTALLTQVVDTKSDKKTSLHLFTTLSIQHFAIKIHCVHFVEFCVLFRYLVIFKDDINKVSPMVEGLMTGITADCLESRHEGFLVL